ncbi:MAG: aspartate aminotransferase family protein [Lentisphaeria bacterium]
MDADEVISIKREYIIPCMYHFYTKPPVLVRGEMQYLYDENGKRYLDCYAGVTVVNCGHCNVEIIEPVIEQLRKLQHTTSIYLSEPLVLLAKELIEFINCDLKKVFFVNSGSEANEGAMLLAKLYTGKKGFISISNGLHGRTALTMNATGIEMWRTDPFPEGLVRIMPSYNDASMRPNSRGKIEALDDIVKLLANDDIAAVIAEPIQGNGGLEKPHPEFFQQLSPILKEYGVLLIFDEVQTGFGRTGKKWGWQHLGVEPDIMTIAKGLGNGFPIAAFCSKDEIAAVYTKPGASTTGGNLVSATAARSVLKYYERNGLISRAEILGNWLKSRLEVISKDYECMSSIRGEGLMLGVVFERDGKPDGELVDKILESMKDYGFLIGKTGVGRNVLTFMPPLVVEKGDLQAMLESLENCLKEQV